jgi:hypothetical protein
VVPPAQLEGAADGILNTWFEFSYFTTNSTYMIQRLIRTAVCALGFTACDSSSTEPAPPPTEDSFAPGALSNYSVHSDQGNPWSLGSNTLEGNGGALQSVLIRNATPMTNGWVETLADSVDDGGLVLRFSDNEHYYLLAVRDDKAPSPRGQDNLEIYRRTAKEAGFVSLAYERDVAARRETPGPLRSCWG